MNGTEYVALIDTTRDEFRDRIADALARFDQLARMADPRSTSGPRLDRAADRRPRAYDRHRYRAGAQGHAYRTVDSSWRDCHA